MALELLNGTTAAFDFTTATRTTFSGTAGTAKTWAGVASYFSADIARELFEQTTFGSSGWRSRIPGMKQLIGHIDGFTSKGLSNSDPLYLFANNFPIAFVATVDTGCTLTGDGFATRHHTGLRAAAQSEMALDFESYGAVTSAWIIV